MRVTERMRFVEVERSREREATRLDAATTQAATGLRVHAPSDDASGFASGLRLGDRIAKAQARLSALDRRQGDAQIAEGALASAGDLMVRARELAMQMANGSIDAKARADAAGEIDQIRQQLLGLANTKGENGYVFGGTVDDVAPFDAAATFKGSATVPRVEIADGVTIAAGPSGAVAFTAAGGRDVFADLAALSKALSTNDVASIQSSLDVLDKGHRQLVDARGVAGLALERISSANDVTRSAIDKLRTSHASTVEADAADAYSQLSVAQSAFQRALEVTKQILALPGLER